MGKREQGAQRLGIRGLPPSPALITSRRDQEMELSSARAPSTPGDCSGQNLNQCTHTGVQEMPASTTAHTWACRRCQLQPRHTRGCAGDATFNHGTHAGVEEMPASTTAHTQVWRRCHLQPVHTRGCAGDATFNHGTHAGVEEMPPALLLFTGAQRLLQAPVLWGGNFRASRFRAPPARQRIRN